MTAGGERVVLVDASAFITLASIGHAELLAGLDGRVAMPATVRAEIVDTSTVGALERGRESGWLDVVEEADGAVVGLAREQLGREDATGELAGDVALLAHSLAANDSVVVTDDKPLRRTCKAHGVPVSGSIGVVIGAVERGDLDPDGAKDALVAMDEVGARLSARLLRRAERLIDGAAEAREE